MKISTGTIISTRYSDYLYEKSKNAEFEKASLTKVGAAKRIINKHYQDGTFAKNTYSNGCVEELSINAKEKTSKIKVLSSFEEPFDLAVTYKNDGSIKTILSKIYAVNGRILLLEKQDKMLYKEVGSQIEKMLKNLREQISPRCKKELGKILQAVKKEL